MNTELYDDLYKEYLDYWNRGGFSITYDGRQFGHLDGDENGGARSSRALTLEEFIDKINVDSLFLDKMSQLVKPFLIEKPVKKYYFYTINEYGELYSKVSDKNIFEEIKNNCIIANRTELDKINYFIKRFNLGKQDYESGFLSADHFKLSNPNYLSLLEIYVPNRKQHSFSIIFQKEISEVEYNKLKEIL